MCRELYLALYTKRRAGRSHSHSERANGTQRDYGHVHYVRSHNSTSGKFTFPSAAYTLKSFSSLLSLPLEVLTYFGNLCTLFLLLHQVPERFIFCLHVCLSINNIARQCLASICKKHSKCVHNPERLSEVKQTCLVTELARTLVRLWAVCSTTNYIQSILSEEGGEGG